MIRFGCLHTQRDILLPAGDEGQEICFVSIFGAEGEREREREREREISESRETGNGLEFLMMRDAMRKAGT